MAFKRESFGLIPDRELVKRLVRIYGNMERWLERNIYSITVDNYTERKSKYALKELNLTLRVFNEQVSDFFELNIPKKYKEAKIKTGTRIEKKFRRDKSKNVNDERILNRHLKSNRKTFLRANNSIPKQAVIYLRLVRTSQSGLLKLQEFEEDEFKDRIKKLVENGLKVRALYTKSGHAYEGTLSKGQVKKQIIELFETEFGKINFIEINGRRYQFKKYADMLARTEMRIAQSEGVIASCKEHATDLMQYSQHASPCRICSPYEGDIYSISGNHPLYSPLGSGGEIPQHPNCEHNWDPYDEILGVA